MTTATTRPDTRDHGEPSIWEDFAPIAIAAIVPMLMVLAGYFGASCFR